MRDSFKVCQREVLQIIRPPNPPRRTHRNTFVLKKVLNQILGVPRRVVRGSLARPQPKLSALISICCGSASGNWESSL